MTPEKDEPSLVEGIVTEFRADNDYRVRAGRLCHAPPGDMPRGVYYGPDKDLHQLCPEIRALSWKMSQLRARIGTLPQQSSGNFNIPGSSEVDAWNRRNYEFHRFCEVVMPLYESRRWRLANFSPNTLRGLARKANVIETEIVGAFGDPTPATSVLRSFCLDIAVMMGEEG